MFTRFRMTFLPYTVPHAALHILHSTPLNSLERCILYAQPRKPASGPTGYPVLSHTKLATADSTGCEPSTQ